MTRPRRTLDEDVEMAALVVDDDAGLLVADEVADEVVPVLLSAALTLKSLGYTQDFDPAKLRSTDPSVLRTSLLAARKLRVYMMFSAM